MEPFGSTWSSKYLQGVKARQLEAKLGKKREVETGVLGDLHGLLCVSALLFSTSNCNFFTSLYLIVSHLHLSLSPVPATK